MSLLTIYSFEVIAFMMSLSKKRILLGSIFLSGLTLLSLWIHVPGLLRYTVGFISCFVVFGFGNFKQFISLSFMFYLLNLSLGGLTFLINQSVNTNLIIGGISVTIIFFIIDKLIFDKKLSFEVSIEVFGERTEAFIDTGNLALIDGISICFMNSRYLNNTFKYVKECRITTINGDESIDLYKGSVKFNSYNVECYIAFKDNIPYDALISPYLLKFKGGRRC